MRTSRQTYKDATYEEAIEARCDTLQLKYDGWWLRIEIIKGQATAYTRTNRPLADFGFTLSDPISATVIGEGMYGTNWAQQPQLRGKVFAYDLWTADDQDLEALPYKTRYALLKTVLPFLPGNFIRVPNFDINDYESVWKRHVVNEGFEGVVFRRQRDAVGGLLLRQKNTITDEYTALGFVEGEGKHANRLGAVIIGDIEGRPLHDSSGKMATVGGGFDDSEREEIFQNQEKYKGRRFEVEGKARFSDTGLLRHPNFVRWKES